ncbi:3-deoxy-8-phosphooctulonate synthase [bacterium]|nr:3-deoxy-8-phosphooctulonate synthase [bacterium]
MKVASAPIFVRDSARPVVIAGPCMAESQDLLEATVAPLVRLARDLDFQLVFKASFDKANRSSIEGYRGPGLERALGWFADIKSRHGVRILTDVHETAQCQPAAEVCDVLQIPAFLCRQTDLIVQSVQTGRAVNIKKGQFMAPEAMANIAGKAIAAARAANLPVDVALTERGASFGYGNLVVDMRAFPVMARSGTPLIFDITHSTQLPGAAPDGKSSGADREFAPVLARAAAATGYLDGFFLEVHTDPAMAKSDKEAQLTIPQAETLLRQVVPLWHSARKLKTIDAAFGPG